MDVEAALEALSDFASSAKATGSRVGRIRAIRRFVDEWDTRKLGELSDVLAIYAIRNGRAFDKKRGPLAILVKCVMRKASKQSISDLCRAYDKLRPIDDRKTYAKAVKAAGGFDALLRAGPAKLMNTYKKKGYVKTGDKWPTPGSL